MPTTTVMYHMDVFVATWIILALQLAIGDGDVVIEIYRCCCLGWSGMQLTGMWSSMVSLLRNYGATAEYSPNYRTAARLEFKSCLWTLGLGWWFGLAESYSKPRECGLYSAVAPNYPWN